MNNNDNNQAIPKATAAPHLPASIYQRQPAPPPQGYASAKEASSLLGLGLQYIYRLVASGKLIRRGSGRRVFIERSSIAAYHQPSPPSKEWAKSDEAALLLHITRTRVNKLARDGRLDKMRGPKGETLISRASIASRIAARHSLQTMNIADIILKKEEGQNFWQIPTDYSTRIEAASQLGVEADDLDTLMSLTDVPMITWQVGKVRHGVLKTTDIAKLAQTKKSLPQGLLHQITLAGINSEAARLIASDVWLSLTRAAELLGTSQNGLKRMIAKEQFQTWKQGRKIFVSRRSIEEYQAAHPSDDSTITEQVGESIVFEGIKIWRAKKEIKWHYPEGYLNKSAAARRLHIETLDLDILMEMAGIVPIRINVGPKTDLTLIKEDDIPLLSQRKAETRPGAIRRLVLERGLGPRLRLP